VLRSALAALLAWTLLLEGAQAPKSGLDLSLLDRSVRPQDDLYRFANGGWLDRTPIPPDRVSVSTFTELSDRAEADVRRVVEDLAGHRGGVERQIFDLYTSMMDEEWIEERGAEAIREQLDRINRITSTKDLASEMGRLSAMGSGGPFSASVGLAAYDPSAIVVTISQGGTLLPGREYYLDEDPVSRSTRDAYVTYLETIFRLASRPQPGADAAAVLALETALARHQVPVAQAASLTGAESFALKDLQKEIIGFDWTAWARPQGMEIASKIVLTHPEFFRAFAVQVADAPLETWKALLAARYITAASIYISRGFADARFEFFGRVLTGQQLPRDRWKRGVSLVSGFLGDAVGRLYVEKHFPESSRDRVRRMVRHILAAFRDAVDEAEWMTPDARAEARRKLENVRARVGYPDRWRQYTGLRIKADDLLGNVERGQQFENRFRMNRVRRPSRGFWTVTPQTVNAFYLPALNEITLPAAILQPPLFNPEAEDAVNYGAIGALIGHEIGHAFDLRGRQFNAWGRMQDWWTPRDVAQFASRAQLLLEQFSAFPSLAGRRVDGQMTLSENIGDLGGLAVAVRAYRRSLDGQQSPVIDGFTGEQRLLIGWAQMWRSLMRDDFLRQTLLLSQHAPPQYRAHGAVMNLEAFYRAFDVRPGDKLYRDPKKRVRIW
jgi:putative endopeptidase